MQTEIYYGDITRTETLENYLLTTIESMAEEFFRRDRAAHLTVRVNTDRPRTATHRPSYTCEVILKSSTGKGVIKIRKTDESFKRCVAKTCAAFKISLAKKSDMRITARRKDASLRDYSFEYAPESFDGVS